MDQRELIQRIDDLERQIRDLRAGSDVEFSEGIKRRTLEGVITAGVKTTATTSDILKAVNEGGAGTYNVALAPANKLRVEIDGTPYYLALYNV